MGCGQKAAAEAEEELQYLASKKADDTEVTIKLGELMRLLHNLEDKNIIIALRNPESIGSIKEGTKALENIKHFFRDYKHQHSTIYRSEYERLNKR